MDLDHRRNLLREGWKDVGKIFVVAVVLDVICQLIVFRWLYPGEALLVANILAILPYLVFAARSTASRAIKPRARIGGR